MSAVVTTPQPSSSLSGAERYFEVSLYLLIATGFLTLASTGKLDALSLLFIFGVLIARGVLLLRNRSFLIPERWTNYATLLFVAFYIADFFLISANFVYATLHLVLLVMAVKIFSVQRGRDYVYLTVLPFLMVLGATILTVDSTFFFSFCLFMLLAISTFISMEMKRSAAASAVRARLPQDRPNRLPHALSATAVVLLIGMLLAGFAIFFVLPRQSGGYLNSLAQNNEFQTGFSNDVELGKIGEIKQSRSVVMHVQISGDARGDYSDLKWRGTALSLFDGHRWTRNPVSRYRVPRSADGSFYSRDIPPGRGPQFNATQPAQPFRPLRYRVLMEPVGSDVFFLVPSVVSLRGRYRAVFGDAAGALFEDEEPIGIYDAYSNIAAPLPERLRAASGAVPPGISLGYLQMPAVDPRVAQLAANITVSSTNSYDKALVLEQYLKAHYGYTLQLPKSLPADPIADFLFSRREGHCEYFASAMAIMLRNLGIPSRVVNGFRGAEFNDLNSTYIVRASSAHTWVEAYFPGEGWASFDPTPPDPKPVATEWSRLGMYLDAMGEFWREWVVNYDFAHQLNLHNEMFAGAHVFGTRWRNQLKLRYRNLLDWARRSQRAKLSWKSVTIPLLLVSLLALLANTPRMLRSWRQNRIADHPEESPALAASIWYQRMTHTVAQRGVSKQPAQTPTEFTESIIDPELRRAVARFTHHYERARFGEQAEDAERLPELYEELVGKSD